MADINQDLLLAVLAVLTDAVPREALTTALAAWAETPERSLAGCLKERGRSTTSGSRPSSAWFRRICRITTETSGRASMPGMPRH